LVVSRQLSRRPRCGDDFTFHRPSSLRFWGNGIDDDGEELVQRRDIELRQHSVAVFSAWRFLKEKGTLALKKR